MLPRENFEFLLLLDCIWCNLRGEKRISQSYAMCYSYFLSIIEMRGGCTGPRPSAPLETNLTGGEAKRGTNLVKNTVTIYTVTMYTVLEVGPRALVPVMVTACLEVGPRQ